MKKIIISVISVLVILFSLCDEVFAQETSIISKTVRINYGGIYTTDTVVVEGDNIFAPLSWLEYYGLMKCEQRDQYYYFYYPDQEQNAIFAKSLWIDIGGSGFDVRYYQSQYSLLEDMATYRKWITDSINSIKESDFRKLCKAWGIKERTIDTSHSIWNNSYSVLKREFSESLIYDEQLYLPLAELLPLINAKIAIDKDGTIYIDPHILTLSQVLSNENINSLIFDADYDMEVSEFVSASALVVDSFLNFRFDRLDFVKQSGQISDYEEIFKSYLVEDEAFLKAYDQEITPSGQIISYGAELFDTGDTALDLLKTEKKFLQNLGIGKEFYPELSTLYDNVFDGVDGTSLADMADGFAKIFDYYNTYQNQIEDHRKMLGAVYDNSLTLASHSPASQAAYNIQGLYGEEYAGRLCAASETAFREYLNKNLPKKAIAKTVAPYAITVAFTKFIVPEDFKTIHNMSLIYVMDEVSATAYDTFLSLKYNNDFSFSSLNDLRLSAIMALIASRHAYSSIWDGNHEKISKIDAVLAKLYLVADSVECDSIEYYDKTSSRLKYNEDKIKQNRSIVPEDYIGMTIKEFIDIWGKDCIGSANEYSYYGMSLTYADNRLPFDVYSCAHDVGSSQFSIEDLAEVDGLITTIVVDKNILVAGELTGSEILTDIKEVLGEGTEVSIGQTSANIGYNFKKDNFSYTFAWLGMGQPVDGNPYEFQKPDVINTKSDFCEIDISYELWEKWMKEHGYLT